MKLKKVKAILEQFNFCLSKFEISDIYYLNTNYKIGNQLPDVDEQFQKLKKGERWGGEADSHCWFYFKMYAPQDGELEIVTDRQEGWNATNPQFIIYINGRLVQGLDVNHRSVNLVGNQEYEVYLYGYTGMVAEKLDFFAEYKVIDKNLKTLYYHLQAPLLVCEYLDPDDQKYLDIVSYLDHAVNLLDFRIPHSDEYNASVCAAIHYLDTEFYQKYCKQGSISTICIGHTHIDIAWLWRMKQTREKAVRSFSTVVELMKQYPEYKFMSSQAILYQFLKEESPEIYEEVKNLIKEGRWEVEGAMWVEADCNLSSGESLVRQILFGKRFFQKEFGVECKVLWLPDVFGYSAALPQILKKSGIRYFVTSKISWNETNQMPNDTFYWQGIDGTKILTYFLTAQDKKRDQKPVRYTTYVGNITPQQVAGTWDRYQNKDLNNEVLLTFGYGDGGGGPTNEMLEYAQRLQKGIPGCPNVKIEFASHFLQKLDDKIKSSKNVPKWVGELYLEFHRGTYTSIAKNKRNNRKSEYLYQEAEWLSSLDMVLNHSQYPQKQLNIGWEMILTNQFHDIIPGSSIREVYEDSDIQYHKIFDIGNEICDSVYQKIAENVKTEGGVLVFNPHSFVNSSAVLIDGRYLDAKDIPPKGYKVIPFTKTISNVSVSEDCIENQCFKIVFQSGNITSIFDKRVQREIIKKGERANVFQVFEDFPEHYDAWEISRYYKEKVWEVNDVIEIEILNEGARAGLKIVKRFLNSVISQNIYLYNSIDRIDFVTTVHWHQSHLMLKALFPVDIHCEKATYDIQFGNLERPTHDNTSWDAAKFEVCAHKYADISEDGYGLSLINDCKYGYDICDNQLRITLLRSPTYPNPSADQGEHQFTYCLYPHLGDVRHSQTIQTAFDVNMPMRAIRVEKQEGKLMDMYSFFCCDCKNIVIETVKKAEDDDCIVVRLYDTYNRRSQPTIKFGFDVRNVFLVDMMERKIEELEVWDNRVSFMVRPFEIVTLKVQPKQE